MTAIINASTSAGITQTGDNSGVLAIQSAGTTVATFNSSGVNAGIQVVSNAAPAFSAYQSSSQSISSGTWTKVTCQTKEFDTNTNYDNTTNYRFTPTVAGYYQCSFGADLKGTTSNRLIGVFYKNGSWFKSGSGAFNGAASTEFESTGSALIYCNGSTDYVELYANSSSGTGTVYASTGYITYINGVMVRGA